MRARICVNKRSPNRIRPEIQHELWEHAVAASKQAPTPPVISFITSLNETIDLDATQLNALRTHVPEAVLELPC